MSKNHLPATLCTQLNYRRVRRWLKKLHVPNRDRNDLVQEVLLQALGSADTFDPRLSRLERWLNRITVHVVSHYQTKAFRKKEIHCKADSLDDKTNPDEKISNQQVMNILSDAINNLHPDIKYVIENFDLKGTPMIEVSFQLGVPISTLYRWRSRGLLELNKKLKTL